MELSISLCPGHFHNVWSSLLQAGSVQTFIQPLRLSSLSSPAVFMAKTNGSHRPLSPSSLSFLANNNLQLLTQFACLQKLPGLRLRPAPCFPHMRHVPYQRPGVRSKLRGIHYTKTTTNKGQKCLIIRHVEVGKGVEAEATLDA